MVALAQYEQQITADFGAWLLALSAKPIQERFTFSQAGPLDAYYIQAEYVLNVACPTPAFWTPVSLWRTADFDAPLGYPSVMWQGVPNSSQNRVEQPQNGLLNRWYEDPANWSEGQKRLLKIMIDHPEKIDLGVGKLGKEAKLGVEAVGAVKKAVEADHRLLNGLGQKILGAQP